MTDATTSSGGPKPAEIAIHVNAEPLTVRAASLADLLDALGYGGQKVATALNGDFVPERARAAATIANGDRVEILSARQGG